MVRSGSLNPSLATLLCMGSSQSTHRVSKPLQGVPFFHMFDESLRIIGVGVRLFSGKENETEVVPGLLLFLRVQPLIHIGRSLSYSFYF